MAQVLWRRKLVCSVVAAIVFAVGAGLLLNRPKVYQSTSSVALLPVSTNAAVLPNYPNLIASLIPTYVQLVSSPLLLNRVAATLPFPTSGTQLAGDVHAESLSNAAIINIVAESGNAIRAQQIASRTTAAFLSALQGNGVVIPRIYGQPTVPHRPTAPKTSLVLGVVLALAVLLGLGAGLVWDRLFPRVDRSGEPAGTTYSEVLGVIPHLGEEPDVATILASRDTKVPHDTWRSLRTNLMYTVADHHAHSVTVTSLRSGEGKTTVAVNLAAAVTELGLEVVLVDAAVRHPTLHEVFGLDNARGLTSAMVLGADPASLLRPVPGIAGLQVLTAGPPLPAPRDESRLYLKELPKFTSLADLVIVDSPPLRGDADAALVASATDGVVLVVGSGANGPKQASAALRVLKRHHAPVRVLGTVLAWASRTVNRDEPDEDSGNEPTSEAAGPAARA